MSSTLVLPREPRSAQLLRRAVVGSFLFFVLFLGVPLWYKTTSIYRAPLDYAQMSTYDQHLPSLVDLTVPVYVRAAGTELPDIVPATQLLVDAKLKELGIPTSPGWNLDLRKIDTPSFAQFQEAIKLQEEDPESAYLVQLVPDNKAEALRVSPYSRELVVSYSQESLAAGDLPEFLAAQLINTFGDEIDQYMLLVHNKIEQSQTRATADLAAAHSTHYHITFSLFVEGGEPVSWAIAPALKRYFAPLERQLSARVANFSIDTQVQFYSTLSSPPKRVHVNGTEPYFLFTQDDLSTFVNFAEWSLSSIHSYPSLNFILYVPSPSHSPLLVDQSPTNSFVIPQWGGVVIYKDSTAHPLHLAVESLAPVLETFTAQLFTLLGAPQHPAASPLFRIDILSRAFALRSLFNAAASLGSLTRLSSSLPEIAIPVSVQTNVHDAVSSIATSLAALRSVPGAPAWPAAVHSAARAMGSAHNAFFEKMMVQQMYFPQEHKIAVYMPLLGPILIVMLMESLRVVSEWKNMKKRRE